MHYLSEKQNPESQPWSYSKILDTMMQMSFPGQELSVLPHIIAGKIMLSMAPQGDELEAPCLETSWTFSHALPALADLNLYLFTVRDSNC